MSAPAALRGGSLAVVLVVAAAWLTSTVWVLTGPLDLGFTTSNVVWQLANAWLWPTVLLALGATAVRSRALAGAGLAVAAIGTLAFAAIVVVQLVLGARLEFVASSLLSLPTALLAAVACAVGVLGTRRSPRGWAIALAIAGLAGVGMAVLEVRSAARGLLGFGVVEPAALLAVALISLTSLAVPAALALLAVPARATRWIAAALLVLSAVLSLPRAVGSLAGGAAIAIGGAAQLLAALGMLAAAVVLVLEALRSPARHPVSAWTAQPQPPASQPLGVAQRMPGPQPPPPAPGTRVPPPA